MKGTREGLGHFTIPRACVNEDPVCRQFIHDPLQPAFSIPLLIRVVKEGLKGLFVSLSLRIKDANAFLVRHAASPLVVTPK